jgi:hypothetical protein
VHGGVDRRLAAQSRAGPPPEGAAASCRPSAAQPAPEQARHPPCLLQVFTLGWNSEAKRLASGSVDQTVRITRVDDHCNVR